MPFYKGHKPYYGFLGKHHTEETRKKLSKSHTGKKLSPEHREKVIEILKNNPPSKEARKRSGEKQKGNLHHNWKGEKVSYRALHNWIVNNFGKANHCEHCGKLDAKVYDWANISGEYKRDISDYIQLCRKCHIKFDDSPQKHLERIKNLSLGWYRKCLR